MNEVAAVAARALVELASSPGLAPGFSTDEILAGLPFDRRSLLRRKRVDWEDYCTMFDRLEVAAGGPAGIEALFASAYHLSIPVEFRTMFGALISPKMLYRFMWKVVDPPLFANLDFGYAELDDGRLHLSVRTRPDTRPCLAFNRGSLGAIRGAPAHLGLPPAEVEVEELTGHTLITRVRLPAASTFLAKAGSTTLPALRRAAMRVVEEYADQSMTHGATLASAQEIVDRQASQLADIGALGRELAQRFDVPSLAETLLVALGKLGWDTATVVVAAIANGGGDLVFRRGEGRVAHVVPLSVGGRPVGRLEVGGRGELPLLEGLAPWIGIAVDNARALASLGGPKPSDDRPTVAEAQHALGLTVRQVHVFERMVRGLSNKEIANEIDCAENTVELHVTQILRKARAHGRTELIARFWARGFRPAN